MNQQERKYLIERINQVANQKLEQARTLIVVTPEIRLSDLERFNALKNGDFTIKKSYRFSYGGRTHIFAEQGVPADMHLRHVLAFKGERDESKDTTKYDAAVEKIQTEVTNIKDQVMLGDSKEAMKMLQAFKNKKFW